MEGSEKKTFNLLDIETQLWDALSLVVKEPFLEVSRALLPLQRKMDHQNQALPFSLKSGLINTKSSVPGLQSRMLRKT